MRYFVGYLFLLMSCLGTTYAQRIYGGQIDRRIIDKVNPYSYGVGCTFFADQAGFDALPVQLRFGVYRKKDNQLMLEYVADKSKDVSGSSSSISCDKSKKVEYLFVRYNYNLTIKPQQFNDPEGYYIVNQPVGPRNPSENVASSQIVLYHWFSPAYLWEYFEPVEAGKTTPQWVPDSYNFFCLNGEGNFSLQIASEPLKSGLTRTNFNLVLSNVAPLTGNTGTVPYQKVSWKAGYSESQMLPGGNFLLPPLPPNIFGGNGITSIVIFLKPTKLGTYSVGFLLQHSRSGVKLSETYREYQIEVETCYPAPPAVIRVSEVGRPSVSASTTVCVGNSVQLNAGANLPDISYEWYKNDQLVAGAKDSILVVKEAGNYRVKVARKGACIVGESSNTIIKVVPNPTVTISSSIPSGSFCPGGSLTLTANPSDKNVSYQWFNNGVIVANETQNTLVVSQMGNYSVKITDGFRCAGEAQPFEVKPASSTLFTMQPLPARCSNDTAAILLVATPAGGTFSGKGVVAPNKLIPQLAGAGNHEITYTLKQGSSCLDGSAKQTIVVTAVPAVELGPDVDVSEKGSVSLNSNGSFAAGHVYQWTPSAGLDNPQVASPAASPEKTTLYTLKVTDNNGCSATDSVVVGVMKGVHIPDAFSPNGDGVNDTWVVRGLDEFPEATITVYNRWGHAIFYSDALKKATFDGSYNEDPLPVGSYAFVIQTAPNGQVFRGKLLLVR